jgi:serine phosphatase RsbU (regulator of sigma subunit)
MRVSTTTNAARGFVPAASDAYAALLERLPAYAEEAMTRRSLKAQQDYAAGEQALKEREYNLREQKKMPRRIRLAEQAAKREAEQERYRGGQRELADRLAHAQEVGQTAQRYGSDMFRAQKAGSARFSRGTRGVPTIY